MQNAVKHLSLVKGQENEEGEDEDEESHILSDFSACMYGYEDKEAFQKAFDAEI
jgi:zinc finger SWIM domain-containing protein 3